MNGYESPNRPDRNLLGCSVTDLDERVARLEAILRLRDMRRRHLVQWFSASVLFGLMLVVGCAMQ